MKIYIYLIMISSLLVYSCESSEPADETQRGDEIKLSSVTEPQGSVTRATTDFPNNGSIGVVVATELDPISPLSTNWAAYSDINNAEAIATPVDANGVYSFEWNTSTPKYWPFDGSDLYFMAYSPALTTEGIPGLALSSDNKELNIRLMKSLPEIMYASTNASPQAYNKSKPNVDLGTFMQALSQLTIKVVADDSMPAGIELNLLKVTTTAGNATLYLPLGDAGLSILPNNPDYVETFEEGNIPFGDIPSEGYRTRLFPGTEDVTMITIELYDTNTDTSFTRNYMMSFFSGDTEAVALQRGKNTILTITVKGVSVQDNLDLKGEITEWNNKGNFEIGIK